MLSLVCAATFWIGLATLRAALNNLSTLSIAVICGVSLTKRLKNNAPNKPIPNRPSELRTTTLLVLNRHAVLQDWGL